MPERYGTDPATPTFAERVAALAAAAPPHRQGHSTRCDCYHGHASASGRCNVRNVEDPTATQAGDAVFCSRCRAECVPHVIRERAGRE
jgi:hypothetical protein